MSTRERRDPQPTGRTITSPISGFTRYDLVLAVIPTAFVAALLARQVLPLSTEASVAFASIVGLLALADGLFLNPPELNDER